MLHCAGERGPELNGDDPCNHMHAAGSPAMETNDSLDAYLSPICCLQAGFLNFGGFAPNKDTFPRTGLVRSVPGLSCDAQGP